MMLVSEKQKTSKKHKSFKNGGSMPQASLELISVGRWFVNIIQNYLWKKHSRIIKKETNIKTKVCWM